MSVYILIKMAAFNSFFNFFCQVINRKWSLLDITGNAIEYIAFFTHPFPFRVQGKEMLPRLGIVPAVQFSRIGQAGGGDIADSAFIDVTEHAVAFVVII